MLFRLRAVIPRALRIPHNLSFLQVNEQHVRRQAKICQNSSKQTEIFKPRDIYFLHDVFYLEIFIFYIVYFFYKVKQGIFSTDWTARSIFAHI